MHKVKALGGVMKKEWNMAMGLIVDHLMFREM